MFIRDDQGVTFDQLLQVCQVTAFDVWRVLISFSKLSTDLPLLLKVHLANLENDSFLEHFWLEKSPLIDLIRSQAANSLIDHKTEKGSVESESAMEGEPVSTRSIEVTQLTLSYTVGHDITQLFFKRFLSVAAERIHTLCQHLEFTEKQMEFVWEIIKFLICEEIEILICRHLDHLIICAIYAVTKKCGEGYDSYKYRKFNDIFRE